MLASQICHCVTFVLQLWSFHENNQRRSCSKTGAGPHTGRSGSDTRRQHPIGHPVGKWRCGARQGCFNGPWDTAAAGGRNDHSPAPHPVTSAWSDGRVKQLQTLYYEGCSARVIAEAMGVTRNAIIGKAHRLGLSRNGSASRTYAPTKPKPDAYRIKREEVLTKLNTLKKISPKPLITLKARECRFPVNRAKFGELHLFCAQPTDAMKTYCPAHHAVVWKEAPRRLK